MKELWSGRGRQGVRGGGGSPPLILQTQQINIRVSQAEGRFHLGTAKIVTRGYVGGFMVSLALFALHLCNYQRGNASRCCFTERNNKSSLQSPKWLDNQCLHYLHNLLKLTIFNKYKEQYCLHCREDMSIYSFDVSFGPEA